jgi:oligopeptidase A
MVLFHEFGHGLQQLLTKVPYSELAGQRNIEWDAVQVGCTCLPFTKNKMKKRQPKKKGKKIPKN